MDTLVIYIGLIVFSIIGSTLTGAGIGEKVGRQTPGGYYWYSIVAGGVMFLLAFGLAYKI